MGAKDCYSPVFSLKDSVYLMYHHIFLIVYILYEDGMNFDSVEIGVRYVKGL